MQQATTVNLRLTTPQLDLEECNEIRVALTRLGSDYPDVVRTKSALEMVVSGHTCIVTLNQDDTSKLRGLVTVGMRAQLADGQVVGSKPQTIMIDSTYDRAII